MKLKLLRGLKDIKENFSYHNDTPVSEIALEIKNKKIGAVPIVCLLYTSPSPRDRQKSRMPSSA